MTRQHGQLAPASPPPSLKCGLQQSDTLIGRTISPNKLFGVATSERGGALGPGAAEKRGGASGRTLKNAAARLFGGGIYDKPQKDTPTLTKGNKQCADWPKKWNANQGGGAWGACSKTAQRSSSVKPNMVSPTKS